MFFRQWIVALLALLSLCGAPPRLARADDFRIESKVFVGDEPEPASVSITMFDGPTVYDFLSDPAQIAIYRQAPNDAPTKFILLDPSRRLRTELKTDEILKFMAGLQAWAAGQGDPLLQFSAKPEFERTFDESSGELILTSDVIRYRLLTAPADSPQVSKQYRTFSDWSTRMGGLLHPGSIPPFARLVVNEALAEHQVLPLEVHLAIAAQKPHRRNDLTIRSQHQITPRLSKQDRAQIDEAGLYLVTFRLVDFGEFSKRPQQPVE